MKDKLIKLIKEKVLREGMTVDETIKYILELKLEINVKDKKDFKNKIQNLIRKAGRSNLVSKDELEEIISEEE